MNIVLSPETQALLEARMKETHGASADEIIRAALENSEGIPFEYLDTETQAAIERAEAERGEGTPLDEAFANLRRKHFGA